MIEVSKKCSVKDCHGPVKANNFCSKHYQRWLRHGHEYDTRPTDWGSREAHPAYKLYYSIRRTYGLQKICAGWQDFWGFAKDIPERPEGNFQFTRKDKSLPWSLENVYWKKSVSKEDRNEYMRQWRSNNKRHCHNSVLKRFYGIGIEEYERMYSEQNGVCKICKSDETCVDKRTKKLRRLAVDHAHDNGKIRGLLCTDCNSGLGRFKDNIELLQGAIEYLKFHTQ